MRKHSEFSVQDYLILCRAIDQSNCVFYCNYYRQISFSQVTLRREFVAFQMLIATCIDAFFLLLSTPSHAYIGKIRSLQMSNVPTFFSFFGPFLIARVQLLKRRPLIKSWVRVIQLGLYKRELCVMSDLLGTGWLIFDVCSNIVSETTNESKTSDFPLICY